ncbi:MAG: hypothetical protein DHS20C17_13230 [Cyclobacteriaceae bacterium]|nr:MAG: hypothetical protein DHS20C17_13230 [Cyclobacteriaceae bacterium]
MEIKYTRQFLNKLEDLFSETEYQLRYERGTFNSGYCILRNTKVAVVNRFYTTEGKISCLLEILRSIQVEPNDLGEKNKKLYFSLLQTTIEL